MRYLQIGAIAVIIVLMIGCGGPSSMNTSQTDSIDSFGSSPKAPKTLTSFWNLAKLKETPNSEVVSESVEKTSTGDVIVQEVKYESPASGDDSIRIFAYYAYPAAKKDGKIPAMVWVHGGACVGRREEAVAWASRGYAAISMDLPGKGGPYRVSSRSEGPDFTDPAIFNVSPTPKESYLYLCVNAVSRAISFMSAQKQVDPRRIGVLGYSWGGVLTLLTNGVDDRVSAACSVFGAGYIPDESYWVTEQLTQLTKTQKQSWREHFDPSVYLAHQHGKTLFVTATNDQFFPIRSFVKTYENATCGKAMVLAPNKNHELDEAATADIARWFDWALRSGSELPQIIAKHKNGKLQITAQGPSPIVSVSLLTADSTNSKEAKWSETELKREGEVWIGSLPPKETRCFVVAKDESGATAADVVNMP